MTFRIAPIAEEHIEGFRAGLDSVARERRYLLYLEAPPPEDAGKFLRNNIRNGYPQYVALVGDRVAGWCDVPPIDRPTRAHNGVLGLGVLAEFRGRGIGTALLSEALQGARAFGFTRVELFYARAIPASPRSTRGSAFAPKECSARRCASTGCTKISSAWRCCMTRPENSWS